MKIRGLAIFGAALLLAVGIVWFSPSRKREPVADQTPSPQLPKSAAPAPPSAVVPSSPVAKAPMSQGEAAALPTTPAPATPPGNQEAPPTRAASMTPTVALPGTANRATPPSATPPSPDEAVSTAVQLDKVGLMLRDYRTLMGTNPVGTNAEIMQAVMGGNPKGAMLGPPEGQSLNGQGELVDRWGTPYFFHQMSATSMEIRSAGPDKVLWTPDDVVQH